MNDGPHMDVPGLERCPDCGQAFVVPVALLDLVDEGLYLLALECKNCGRLALGVHEDAELEQLERFHDHAAAAMASDLEDADVARFIDEIGGFRAALEHDLLQPEDF